MKPKTEELLKRTFNFGVNCLMFLKSLPKDKIHSFITFQLAKLLHQLVQIMKKLKVQNQEKILFI